jgi:predicted nucleic acid-binding protein
MAAFYAPAAEDLPRLVVPSICLLEVHRFLSRTFPADQRDICLAVMRRAQVADLTYSRAVAASNAMTQHKLAMADAIMYSIAQEFKATFWTQDSDYQGLPGVQYKSRG